MSPNTDTIAVFAAARRADGVGACVAMMRKTMTKITTPIAAGRTHAS